MDMILRALQEVSSPELPHTPALSSASLGSSSCSDESLPSMPPSTCASKTRFTEPSQEGATFIFDRHRVKFSPARVTEQDGPRLKTLPPPPLDLQSTRHPKGSKRVPPPLPLSPFAMWSPTLPSAPNGDLPEAPACSLIQDSSPVQLTRNNSGLGLPSTSSSRPISASSDDQCLSSTSRSFDSPSVYDLAFTPSPSWEAAGTRLRSTWSPASDISFDNEEERLSSEVSKVIPFPLTEPPVPREYSQRGHRRRWSLPLALSDLDQLSKELEYSHGQAHYRDQYGASSVPPTAPSFSIDLDSSNDASEEEYAQSIIEIPVPKLDLSLPSPPYCSHAWKSTQQGLLRCRELINSESQYLDSLQNLVWGQGQSIPPAEGACLPALIDASQALLVDMEQNPSVEGVANAFLAAQTSLHDSLIRWCGATSSFPIEVMDSAPLEGSDDEQYFDTNPITPSFALVAPASWPIGDRPGFHDVLSLPSQRIFEYPVLFQDLLSYTAVDSPSYGLVELALYASFTLVEKCSSAHRNSAVPHIPL